MVFKGKMYKVVHLGHFFYGHKGKVAGTVWNKLRGTEINPVFRYLINKFGSLIFTGLTD